MFGGTIELSISYPVVVVFPEPLQACKISLLLKIQDLKVVFYLEHEHFRFVFQIFTS